MFTRDPYAFRELWNQDDPAGSERELKALMLSAKATGDGPLVAQILAYTARAQAAQELFEEAHDSLNDADFILLHLPPHPAHARAIWERSRVFSLCGLGPSAQRWAEQARLKAEETRASDVLAELQPPGQ